MPDGEEKWVEEHEIGVTEHHNYSAGFFTTDYEINGPKVVTQELADKVQWEFNVDVEEHGVEVIDIDAEGVNPL